MVNPVPIPVHHVSYMNELAVLSKGKKPLNCIGCCFVCHHLEFGFTWYVKPGSPPQLSLLWGVGHPKKEEEIGERQRRRWGEEDPSPGSWQKDQAQCSIRWKEDKGSTYVHHKGYSVGQDNHLEQKACGIGAVARKGTDWKSWLNPTQEQISWSNQLKGFPRSFIKVKVSSTCCIQLVQGRLP